MLNRSISFAKSITTLSDSVMMNHPIKSLLFDKMSLQLKKRNYSLFDVTMRSYNGTEICELARIYLFYRLNNVIDKNGAGLDRDEALAAINNSNVPKLDRLMKDINTLFKEESLLFTIHLQS